MNITQFLPEDYFDLEDFPFKDIFSGIQRCWEVLTRITEYTNGALMQGKNCTIHKNVNIREGVLLGDNVHIGFGVELKNCIILNNTHIAHLNYVGDSIIGNRCNISGGAMFANKRLDKSLVSVKVADRRIETGLEKFSAIVGDDSWIGVNSVLNPGTILGKKSQVYPLKSVTGVHKHNEIIR